LRDTRKPELDLRYGDTPRERLDFYASGKPKAPTLLFIHGGYWQMNDKEDFNFIAEGDGWEFDFSGSGTVGGLALTGSALISDPFDTFNSTPTLTGRPFSGTATVDGANPGRYIFPLAVTVAGVESDFATVIYQASGGQLLWLDEDDDSVFLGSLQQQGSLNGIPGPPAKRAREQIVPEQISHQRISR